MRGRPEPRNDSVAVILVGLDNLKRRLRKTQRQLDEAAIYAMEKVTEPLVAKMKAFVPKDTGALERSLGRVVKRLRAGVVFAAAGPTRGDFIGRRNRRAQRYAHLVEYGSSKRGIPARPYVRPAWFLEEPTFNARFSRSFFSRLRWR